MSKQKKPHQIYVIADANGWLKIGISTNLARRLMELQLANAQPLTLVASVTLLKVRAELAERHAHSLLARFERRGEWFRTDRKNAIAAITKAADPIILDSMRKSGIGRQEFIRMLDILELTDAGAARVLGTSIERIQGFRHGSRIPETISKLLKFMSKYGTNGYKDFGESRLEISRKTLPPFSKIARHGYN